MRLFGGDRLQTMMERLNVDENTPIEASILSNTIENAQKKVESRNFAIRKNVLQYDDVMNRQREIIYEQRDRVLDGDNVKPQIWSMIEQALSRTSRAFCPPTRRTTTGICAACATTTSAGWSRPDELHYAPRASRT